ncbi:MAG: PAS domain S-box protein [Lentisphaerae bacterium]|nr:PAS domain S-box protein [Lentisphaerota bacterium]
MVKRTSILMVGGTTDDAARLEAAAAADLSGGGVERVASAHAALARLLSDPPRAILIVDGLPDMPAAALCERLKQDPPTAGIPVLIAIPTGAAPAKTDVPHGGAEGVIHGPVDTREALDLLRALLRFKRRFDDQMRREKALETVLRQRTNDLWAMEERFRVLVENSPDAVFVEAEDGTVLDVNPAACRLHGLRRADLIGRNVADLVPPEEADRVRRDFSLWFSGEIQQIEGASWTHDGRRIPVEVRASILNHEGRKAAILHVRDISDRKRVEAERERLEHRYRNLVEQIPAITYIFDLELRKTVYISPQVETLLGFSPAVWTADPDLWQRQIHPDDVNRVRRAILERHDQSHEPFTIEYRALTSDGRSLWISNHGVYLRDTEAGHWVLQGVMMDLTARREAEEALRSSREQLAQAQKMEAIGRLSGGIAHDFNNMLTTILGYGQLLNADSSLPAGLKGDLGEILRAGERAEVLVRQLLSYGRPSPSEKTPMDVSETVRGMDRLLRRTLGKDIEIVSLLDGTPCIIEGDANQMSQALMNLAVHARDAMPKGGTLTLATDVLLVDDDYAREHPALSPGPYVRLEVADTGPELTPEELETVFEPFSISSPGRRGSGLGLAVVHSIVSSMNGFAEALSAPGRGTRFRLYFPHRPDLCAVSSEPEPAEVAGGAETVLVVDDERGVRHLAARMLRSAGYEVAEASSGIEALHLYEKEPDRFGLVLTDIIMPQMSGTELVQRIRARWPAARAMCMTGYMHEPFVEGDGTGPRLRILQKPFTRGALLLQVRQTLDGVETDDAPA